ncbi:hypothetical protein [Polaromonas sp.]|nr:hypothetical protein [Polaromonas sp.]MDI1274488.1 hypothetical protein [Polaromonas sp.]
MDAHKLTGVSLPVDGGWTAAVAAPPGTQGLDGLAHLPKMK